MKPHQFHRFTRLGSTREKAAELAAGGCSSGTVVIADEQTSGQGRHGRTWHSEPGSGVYLSEIWRSKICPDSLPVATLALGLATAEAISKTAGLPCDLRWPNDVLINGRKCAGILVQLHDGVLILGIGINVNHTAFPVELSGTATSLSLASGHEYDRELLVTNLIESIDLHMDTLMRDGKAAVLSAFTQASSYVWGRKVLVDQDAGILEGTTEGLDEQGFLILRQNDGRRTLILAGGVRPACS
ncbi:MAG: biotin--[acetyl-CoA-carboxylase] ligase [Bryobacteraceae bacterium]